MPETNHKFGKLAEDFICRHLVGRGYSILTRNYRTIGSEVDIIATTEDILVAVEVKYRHRLPDFDDVSRLLNFRKMMALQRGIDKYLQDSDTTFSSIRLDFSLVYRSGNKLGFRYWENV